LHKLTIQNLNLLSCKLVFIFHFNIEGVLISVVVQVYKAVVEEEARITFLSIRVVHLLSALYILISLNDEPLTIIAVRPVGLAG
jgi:hypothetical protein